MPVSLLPLAAGRAEKQVKEEEKRRQERTTSAQQRLKEL